LQFWTLYSRLPTLPRRFSPALVAAGLVTLGAAAVHAQEAPSAPTIVPTVAPTPVRPDAPPPEAINCVRPNTAAPRAELSANDALELSLDTSAREVVVAITRVPAEATCYALYRRPSDVNPVLFAYDSQPIKSPSPQPDPHKPAVAGEYCYSLVFGSPQGSSAPFERCINVPTSLAPAPTPVSAAEPPPQPVTGPPSVGNSTDSSVGYSIPALGAIAAGLALLGTGAYRVWERRRPRN